MAGNYKHGGAGTRLYSIWKHMRRRCHDRFYFDYPNWGGRGIKPCPEWSDFACFRDWALASGYAANLSIERKDNNKGYSPDNCYWATDKQQSNNTRRNLVVTAFGETKTVAQWVSDARCVVKQPCLYYRINTGWSAEQAITQQSRQQL